MASDRAKKLVKRIIAYPEDQPAVVSSKDWVYNLVKDPKDFVSQLPSIVPSLPFTALPAIGRPLSPPTFPYPWLDYPLQ
jgi:hypothetical protein